MSPPPGAPGRSVRHRIFPVAASNAYVISKLPASSVWFRVSPAPPHQRMSSSILRFRYPKCGADHRAAPHELHRRPEPVRRVFHDGGTIPIRQEVVMTVQGSPARFTFSIVGMLTIASVFAITAQAAGEHEHGGPVPGGLV